MSEDAKKVGEPANSRGANLNQETSSGTTAPRVFKAARLNYSLSCSCMDVSMPAGQTAVVETLPLGLPPELAERVAALLSPNEVALTFRLVHKATAEVAEQHNTVHLSQPVPEDAFARCWLDPARCRTHTVHERRELLRLTCGTGVLANMGVALQASGLVLRPHDVAAAAGGGHLPAVQWLRDQCCPWSSTALTAAAAGGHGEVVGWLAGAGCPLIGEALEAAVRGHHGAVVQQLLSLRCAVSTKAYELAASTGRVDLLQLLLDQGPKKDGMWQPRFDTGSQLLAAAAEGCSLDQLQALYAQLYAAYIACYSWLTPQDAQRLLMGSHRCRGNLAASASIRSQTEDWQAKTTWLVEEKGLERCVRLRDAEDAEGSEQVSRLEWLEAQGFQVLDAREGQPNAAERAARGGDVEAMRRAMDEEGLEVRHVWAHGAAKAGHVGVVTELRARGAMSLRDAARGAVEGGHVQLLEKLLGSGRARDGVGGGLGGSGMSPARDQGASTEAGHDGTDARTEQVAVDGDDCGESRALGEGAGGGASTPRRIDDTWQNDLHKVLGDADLFCTAASSHAPSLEVLRWLRARGCGWDESAFAEAAGRCSMETVEWMAAEGCPMGTDGEPYVKAAAQGDMAMLSCLKRLGCPWSKGARADSWGGEAMFNCALRQGAPLVALKWLDEQGCPTDFVRALKWVEKNMEYGALSQQEGSRELLAWIKERKGQVEEERARFEWRFGPGEDPLGRRGKFMWS